MSNRLAHETSPYLLQHKDNPVDWYPWGDDAFDRARAEDKPVLVSIGYSSCHWCHVMERESFVDPLVAAVMNENFICVKVDREERPDVDAIYMDAVQAMTGSGGWPLNAFVTPDGVPFYAGTYFPPNPRHGMPSWTDLLHALADAWTNRRDEVRTQAQSILSRLSASNAPIDVGEEVAESVVKEAVLALESQYDPVNGGFGGAPKFPPHSVLEFLLAVGEYEMPLHTMRAMAQGGIYDQIGGGFSRYTVDAQWVVPHFEKMLYDNALLARAYIHAWQVSGEAVFADVATGTLDWMLRDLRQPDGEFGSALDADSEGEEGKFYVWSLDEMIAVLGEEQAAVAAEYFGVTREGNFEGKNILVRAGNTPPPALSEISAKLLAARNARVWPGLDDKRITSWNALAVAALAEAGAVLKREDYLTAAVETAEFIDAQLTDATGRLLRTYNKGKAKLDAYLEDHAYLLEALLTLYEATFDPRWFTRARELAEVLLTRFADSENGGFFSTSLEHEQLIVRRKEITDSPIPAGQASAALGLLRLAAFTGEAKYEDAALSVIRPLQRSAARYPSAFGHLLRAIDFHCSRVQEVALVGEDVSTLRATVYKKFRPHLVLAGGPHRFGSVATRARAN